jgi:mRNA interferase RelE/StbE
MYRLILHKNVIKFLQSRSSGEKFLISKRLDLLKDNPYNHPELDIKKIKGIDDIFRLRVGRIRILYTVKESELLILVMVAALRGDIYKK